MELPPITQRFVLHFGEMGSRWGISRTVGQIYALLFISDEPLNAEQIAGALGFSRSNVSMGLKELQAWNLVRLRHVPGDRREYFGTPDDIWEIVRTLAEERKKREIDPTQSMMRELLMETPESPTERHAQDKIGELIAVMELLTGWYEDVRALDNDRLARLLRLGAAVQQVLKFTDKVRMFPKSGAKPHHDIQRGGDSPERHDPDRQPDTHSKRKGSA